VLIGVDEDTVSSTVPTRLLAETEFYDSHKAEWLRIHRNEFVVAKGTELLGFFTNFRDAYYAGVEKYGMNTDFLVKRVVEQEPVFVVF